MSEITDAYSASRVVLDYFAEKGKAIFSHEVISIFKTQMAWVIEIKSMLFRGIVIIDLKTGEVVKEVAL